MFDNLNLLSKLEYFMGKLFRRNPNMILETSRIELAKDERFVQLYRVFQTPNRLLKKSLAAGFKDGVVSVVEG